MRIERAIDAFLDWRRLERDATPRSVDSYWRILWKLAEDYPEIELARVTTEDLRKFLNRWRDASGSTRSNVISVLHSFFDWALVEDLTDVEQFVSQYERVRKRKNPKEPASEQALWRMVRRVCKRAGVQPLSPHQLRHGFANRFLRESGRDVGALRPLLGHSRIDTTQLYTDEIELDELKEALDAAYYRRNAQASPDWTTLDLSTLKYPRNRFME